jgi:hypothetical protein
MGAYEDLVARVMPPKEGLQAHTVSYHARMTPLLLKRLEWVQEREKGAGGKRPAELTLTRIHRDIVRLGIEAYRRGTPLPKRDA